MSEIRTYLSDLVKHEGRIEKAFQIHRQSARSANRISFDAGYEAACSYFWNRNPAPAEQLSATDAVQTCLDIAADYWKSAGDTIADFDRPTAEERGRIQAATAITANLQAFWETLSQTPTPEPKLLEMLERVLTFPVASEINSRGYNIRTEPGAAEYAVELIKEALAANREGRE